MTTVAPVLIATLLASSTPAGAPRQDTLSPAAARRIIAEGNEAWGRARVSQDTETFEQMLASDFYVRMGEVTLTRAQFIANISATLPRARLTRFDASVLTVQPDGQGWTAVIKEKLEYEQLSDPRRKRYSLWVTRDGWKKEGGRWVIAFSEAIATETWVGEKPPFEDW